MADVVKEMDPGASAVKANGLKVQTGFGSSTFPLKVRSRASGGGYKSNVETTIPRSDRSGSLRSMLYT
ncbi:MAG: hypothetical protein WA884_16215, partial [Methyloceanibacter sp.]